MSKSKANNNTLNSKQDYPSESSFVNIKTRLRSTVSKKPIDPKSILKASNPQSKEKGESPGTHNNKIVSKNASIKQNSASTRSELKSNTLIKTNTNSISTGNLPKKSSKNTDKKQGNKGNIFHEVKSQDASKSPVFHSSVTTKSPLLVQNPMTSTSTQTDTCVQINEGLLEKIRQQGKEIISLKEKISLLEKLIPSKNVTKGVQSTSRTGPTPPSHPKETTDDGFNCYITGDSHVRGISEELLTILPRGCHPQSFFRPGADFHSLANLHLDSPNLVNPTPDDCVVIMCGTADICCTQWEVTQKAVDTLLTKFQDAKQICFIGVPIRYDRKKINFHISRFNLKLKSYLASKNLELLQFLDPNKFLKPNNLVRDRVHLNKRGKSKLCMKIATLIKNRYNTQNIVQILSSCNGPTPTGLHNINNKTDDTTYTECPPLVPITEYPPPSVPIPSKESSCNVSFILDVSHDLIDLTDPGDEQESLPSVICNDTILFPESVVNNDTLDLESTFSPLDLSTARRPSDQAAGKTSSNFYHLTHVSLSSFSNTTLHSSSLITNTPTPVFQKQSRMSEISPGPK